MTGIIAEIGLNFNGSIPLALKTIEAAKACGCDAVKFQNFKVESFIHQRSEFWEYENDGVKIKERQYDMFKRHELSFADLLALSMYAKEIGIGFGSTPMCRSGVDELVMLGVPWLKNGSDCLQDLGLIEYMGLTGLPTIISTGMAHLSDIDAAVRTFRATGNDGLTLMQCCSAYPAPDDSMNIRRISTMRDVFGCPVGLSDHSQGISAAALSVGQGATVIEKHFTLDKKAQGSDHWFSADPAEMTALVKAVRQAEKQIGSGVIGMTDVEAANRAEWFK